MPKKREKQRRYRIYIRHTGSKSTYFFYLQFYFFFPFSMQLSQIISTFDLSLQFRRVESIYWIMNYASYISYWTAYYGTANHSLLRHFLRSHFGPFYGPLRIEKIFVLLVLGPSFAISCLRTLPSKKRTLLCSRFIVGSFMVSRRHI